MSGTNPPLPVTPFPTPRPGYSAQEQSYADFAVLPLLDVGLEQIRAGMAWHYKEYQHEQTTQDRLVYRDEEDAAKAARRGLWRDAKPVPPWEWRQRKSEASAIPR